MGASRYPHGIIASPVIGAGVGRFDGWWGKTYFVDYDHGGSENDGLTPSTALSKLQSAIDLATINDVIYVRNRDQEIGRAHV